MSSSLRRIFSPPNAKVASSQGQLSAAERREQAQNARKRFFTRLCACLSPQPNVGPPEPSLDLMFQQIADLEPTYEPVAPLLEAATPELSEKICLVLDLDETLVHSSFTPIDGADFEIPLNMQGETHTVYVKKRPGVDHFLAVVAESFEVIVFTASLALYANPVMDLLDPNRVVHGRLYREHCVLIGGCYVKDIAKLGRDLKRTLIVDNSPLSYALQPENSVPIEGFFNDESDRELERVLGLLEKAKALPDVRKFAE
jgi:RNA polymerase II subunit A small phosphatase-like protein